MIYSAPFITLLAAAYLLHVSIAHPGQAPQELHNEMIERGIFFQDTNTPRDLSHGADVLRKRGAEEYNRESLGAAVAKARADLYLLQSKSFYVLHSLHSPRHSLARCAETVVTTPRATNPLSTSHHSGLDVTPTTANVEEIIHSNSSCILSLEGEIGPLCK